MVEVEEEERREALRAEVKEASSLVGREEAGARRGSRGAGDMVSGIVGRRMGWVVWRSMLKRECFYICHGWMSGSGRGG